MEVRLATRFIFSICLLLLSGAQAQIRNCEALLWELTHDSIPHKSYLFGTMHVRDKRAFQFPDSMMTYLQQCKVFAGELNMADVSAVSPSSILLPDDVRLETLLLKQEYKVVKKVCRKQLNALENMLVNRVKPVFVSALLAESMLKNEMPQALDEYLQKEAKKSGLEITGLESVNEQLDALSTMSLKDQAQYLYEEALHFKEAKAAMNTMTNWYMDGQLDSLYLVTVQDSSMQGEVGEAMLGTRNVVMADRLVPMLKRQPVFCAIGAAHLPADDGVLALLQQKGFRIRPIRRTSKL